MIEQLLEVTVEGPAWAVAIGLGVLGLVSVVKPRPKQRRPRRVRPWAGR